MREAEVSSREERVDPLYYRLFKSILLGSFEGSLNLHRMKILDADSIMRITKQVVERAAASGNCVIVGRGSQHFLRDQPDTLRVFLYAPRDAKVSRLISEGMDAADAEQLVDTVDNERAAFVDKYFHLEWPHRAVYHAMLNTDAGEEAVVQTILGLKSTLERPAE